MPSRRPDRDAQRAGCGPRTVVRGPLFQSELRQNAPFLQRIALPRECAAASDDDSKTTHSMQTQYSLCCRTCCWCLMVRSLRSTLRPRGFSHPVHPQTPCAGFATPPVFEAGSAGLSGWWGSCRGEPAGLQRCSLCSSRSSRSGVETAENRTMRL